MSDEQNEFGVYIHWPFCISKCNYCNFNSYVVDVQEGFLEKYLQQIDGFKEYLSLKTLKTIYFGGGTPSLMNIFDISSIITRIKKYAGKIADDLEITLEVNPETVDKEKLQNFYDIGVNRLSFGIQSFKDEWLLMMGRKNNRKKNIEIIAAVDEIFKNYSVDLIYSLPNQITWEAELNESLEIAHNAKHFSLYELSIEKGTVFDQKYTLSECKDYIDITHDIMISHGFDHYEISNYAKDGLRSKHNMLYWEYKDYIGIGAGAHGRVTFDGDKYSFEGERNLKKWLNNELVFNRLSKNDEEIERLIMGLRTDLWCNINDTIIDRPNIDTYIDMQFLELNKRGQIRTTFEGKKRLNSLIESIIKDDVVVTS